MNLAIFGGTFNPIHQGHLRVAQNAFQAAALDRVIFMPCSIPPHKPGDCMVSATDRLEMIRLAIGGRSGFEASDLEVRRGGTSYAIDTLQEVARIHPGADLFFIVGSDNFQTLGEWRKFPELIRLCTFLVVERPGCSVSWPPPTVSGEPLKALKYQICPGSQLDISSSDIRRDLEGGKNVSQFLVPPVYDYIRNHRLYSFRP